MLTLVESLSLAGDRAKQNDDALGAAGARAWVIDGATDLHDAPFSGAASDAAWIARFANASLHAPRIGDDLRGQVRDASVAAAAAFRALAKGAAVERWQSPIASLVLIAENESGVHGVDLGDCRAFALDASGAAYAVGGPPRASDNETQMAAQQAQQAGATPLLKHGPTLDFLRKSRAAQGPTVFGLDPACADQARAWDIKLKRTAYVLLASDGFAALVDRYDAYTPATLIRAALDKGLQELGRELRDIEDADAGGAQHPRWKRSDDATALLLRLS